MAEWIFDQCGFAGVIFDEYSIRGRDGVVIAWVFGISVFSLAGEHMGWFEDGVLFDSDNSVLGFIESARGLNFVRPIVQPAPPMPSFRRRPYAPALHGKHGRPESINWSAHALETYFVAKAGQGQAVLPVATARRMSTRLIKYRQRASSSAGG
jgi:hypothetical protein